MMTLHLLTILVIITVMALQQFLLSQGYMQNLQKPVDGDFGPTTIKELQKYLLAFERGY